MPRPKLIIFLSRFPFPLEKGDKLRAYHQIKQLHLHFDIYLYCLSFVKVSKSDQDELNAYTKGIRIFQLNKWTAAINFIKYFFTNKPLQNGLFYNATIQKSILQEWQIIQPDLVYLQLQRVAEYVESTSYIKIIDFQDAFSLNYKKSAEQTLFPYSWFYSMEHKRVFYNEKKVLNQFDAATIISKRDSDFLDDNRLVIVPNGVDTNFFINQEITPEFDLVFIGNLGYKPNELAVQWIVEKLMPSLKIKRPSIKLLIAGASPTSYIEAIHDDSITLQKWLPDIRTAYASGKIFIAPLFSGAGLQNKVLEAMSMALPCIVSSNVNESIQAKVGTQILVANDVKEFENSIIMLLESDRDRVSIGETGKEFVKENFSWRKNTEILIKLLQDLLRY